MIRKNKVARSKEFMSYAHSTKPATCCICMDKPFVQIHHFGSNGGCGMKPSDYQVARVCKTCADKWELKRNALVKNGYYEVLAAFQQDALELHEGWLSKLEESARCKLHTRCVTCDNRDGKECCAQFNHVEPPIDCALDELYAELYSGLLDDPVQARAWLIEWANRRAANVIEFLAEPMKEIAGKQTSKELIELLEHVKEMQFVALQALKVAGIDISK